MKPLERFLRALNWSVFLGVLTGIVLFFSNETSWAYFKAGPNDVILAYLQRYFGSAIISIGAALIIYELVLHGFLKSKNRTIDLLSLVILLSATVLLLFNQQKWFPGTFTMNALILDAMVFVGILLIALLYIRMGVKVQGVSLAARKFLTVGVCFLIFYGFTNYKKAQAESDAPNVIIILIDALRSDHLGCYGYSRDTSPNIDVFASEGVLFRNSFAQSAHTKPSISSLFTSLLPSQHGVVRSNRRDAEGNYISDVLDDSFKTMAEYLHDSGYNTAGFIDQGQIRSYMGFAQGFNYYNTYLGIAPLLNRDFFDWLPVNQHGKFFAYIHYLDVHAPYTPPKKYFQLFGLNDKVGYIPAQGAEWRKAKDNWGKFQRQLASGKLVFDENSLQELMALYDAEIRALDEEIGKLFDRLKAAGVYENSLIILTADHGEEFMEHGMLDHGSSMYEEILRVPLIIRFPNGAKRGSPETPAQTVDILPTLLDFLAIPHETTLMGRSLVDAVDSPGDAGDYPIISERGHLVSIRRNHHKYIYNSQLDSHELYDLNQDPLEQKNIYTEEPAIAKQLQSELDDLMDAFQHLTKQSKGVKLDEETIKKLKTLGYIR